MLETEVDDASPQLLGPLLDRLLAAGRARRLLHAGADEEGPARRPRHRDRRRRRGARPLEELLFRETTTLGVRRQEWERTVARARDVDASRPPTGRSVSRSAAGGGVVYNAWPEFDDCQRAAAEQGVAVKEVLAAALAAWRAGDPGSRMSTSEARFGHHDADLLRQRRAARRARLHDDRGRHARRARGASPASDVFFLTGTDEHGQNIERIAREKGISEQEHCDRISARVPRALGAATTSATTASSARPRTSTAAAC